MSSRPQDLVERALELSRADGCIVIADQLSTANLRWANNTLTTNGVSRGRHLTVIAIKGTASGVVSREGVTTDGLEDLVRAAEHTATTSAPADDFAPLIDPADQPIPGGGAAWEDPPAETSIATFGVFAQDLGAYLNRAADDDQLVFGFAQHEMRSTFVGTSTGLRLRHDQPTGHVEVNAKSRDMARSAWVGVASRDFTDVDVDSVEADLSRRLGWAERRTDLSPGRYETILPPSAVADLMIYLYWSAAALDAHEGRSVFSKAGGGTRVGERLSDKAVNLRSDPTETAIACTPFVVAHESSPALSVFDNGMALAPCAWIANGVLQSLVQTRRSAGATGLAVTPYIDNLILEAKEAEGSLEDVVARTSGPALLLTCLWYIREVDPRTLLLTGLTRDGVYLVEGGEVTAAVNNFRFNESPVDLLDRLVQVGSTERTLPREWCDYFTRTAMPPLVVDGFNMSTVSPAS
jgi:predicted Zn-dependent protease